MSTPTRTACPHCLGSSRLFSQHGLSVHIGHKHKDVAASASQAVACVVDVAPVQSRLGSQDRCLEDLGFFKKSIPVLRHIPKAARNSAANRLSVLLDRCVEFNSSEDWYALLTFSFKAFRVPSRSGGRSLTKKVKDNILSLDASLPSDGDFERFSSGVSLTRIVESKVFEGDLSGAVRVLISDDSFAEAGPETLASLHSKHPHPSRSLSFPDAPGISIAPLVVKSEQVALALSSFRPGSSAGLDGLRPAHLKELVSNSAGDSGPRLLESLTSFINFMLSGQVNLEVLPYLYGASLCALRKKDGGLRPIAVGSTLRRLAAKLACGAVKEAMSEYLQPRQLGFGTLLGCEAAIHATRAFVADMSNSGSVVIKLDIRNAFNSLERDILLKEVLEHTPSLYPFLYQVYRSPSNLFYNNNLIASQVGAQQGDPLGPLVFSLCLHKVIMDLKSPLNVWYLDDGTLGGTPDQVRDDLRLLIPRLAELGLEVNGSKCEIFPCGSEALSSRPFFDALLPGLRELTSTSFFLLGSPIFTDAVPIALEQRRLLLLAAVARLMQLSSHVALLLLRMCFAAPKVMFLLRTAPTWLHSNEVSAFDLALRESVVEILNVNLTDSQWDQVSLPVRFGGLGVRRVADIGLPAFLGSVHGVLALVTKILSPNGGQVIIPFASEACETWRGRNPGKDSPCTPAVQRCWDEIGSRGVWDRLLRDASGYDLARLRGISGSEAGAWLHALPSPNLGTLLDNESLRVAVGIRLGCDVVEPHVCICGSTVDARGYHALSCGRCLGRFPRHHSLNDIIRRALISAGVPCLLEPPGLSRSDGKRPDGLTLVPWQRGRCLIWDATCVNTFAGSHLARTMAAASAAAESAAASKHVKYAALQSRYLFFPVAFETCGAWGREARVFVDEIGQRLRTCGLDHRAGSFLVQRLAIAIQRGNAASILGSFAPGTFRDGLFE